MKVTIIICAILSGCLLFTTAAAKTSDERAARELVQQLENKLKLQQSYNDKVANENQSGFDDDDDDEDDNAALVNEADMMDNQYQDDESSLQDYGDDDNDDGDDDDELSLIQEDGDEDSSDEDDDTDSQTASSSWFRKRRRWFKIRRPSIIRRIKPTLNRWKSSLRSRGGAALRRAVNHYCNRKVSSAQSASASTKDAEEYGELNTAIAMSLYDEDEKFYSEMQEALSAAGDDDDDYANMELFRKLRRKWRKIRNIRSRLRKLKTYIDRCPRIRSNPYYHKYSKYLGRK